MALIQLYGNCTIDGSKPIEGSVNISVDEGNNEVTKLKYEGGDIAAIKVAVDKSPTCTVEWKTAGKIAKAKTEDDTEITIVTDLDSTGISFTGIHIQSPAWDSQWGFITQHKLIEVPTESAS